MSKREQAKEERLLKDAKAALKDIRAFKRKLQDEGSPAVASPAQVFGAYMLGWCDGTSMGTMSPGFTQAETPFNLGREYKRGYAVGRAARNAQAVKVAKRTRYAPYAQSAPRTQKADCQDGGRP
jgi:hypothetical protein